MWDLPEEDRFSMLQYGSGALISLALADGLACLVFPVLIGPQATASGAPISEQLPPPLPTPTFLQESKAYCTIIGSPSFTLSIFLTSALEGKNNHPDS